VVPRAAPVLRVTIRRRASERANHQYSCGFGRTVPQFTFSLFKRFVNLISTVSTGFFRFLLVFPGLSTKKQQISLFFAFAGPAKVYFATADREGGT